MRIQDTTQALGNHSDFESQALFALATKQNRLNLQFTDVDAAQAGRLQHVIHQLDGASQVLDRTVVGLLTLEAAKRLNQEWPKLFHDQAAAQGQLRQILKQYDIIWQAGDHRFNLTEKAMIYAVMNITPDSFYDGGRYQSMDAVLKHVEQMLADGADIIEVNGQTTRPGFKEVTPEVEIERTIPYMKAIRQAFPKVVFAIDTYKLPVMKAAIDEGVSIINDVNAFTDNPDKLALLAQNNVGLLTMHSSRGHEYDDLTTGMHRFFEQNLADITSAGIDIERIALDQGIGYSKVPDGAQDYVMMRNLDQFNDFRRPIMTAISRKGYLGLLLGLKKDERLPMTLVTEAEMYLKGGRILRVHDVKETKQLVTLLDEIRNGYWLPTE